MIKPGQQFGLYVVKEVLEENDSYACCCAEDPFFNREVALNVYPEGQFGEGKQLEQIEAMLERLSVLDHPSIAPIYDSGREDGFFYYTSACYVGESLAQRIVDGVTTEQALKIVLDVTQALDYAHNQGLDHGQLVAEKVFFDADERAVLSGFGIDLGIRHQRVVEEDFNFDSADENKKLSGNVAETLQSIGELLLRMLLGPAYKSAERIDDRIAGIDNEKIRSLLGRFLLPGERRFASYAELLNELDRFEGGGGIGKGAAPSKESDENSVPSHPAGGETPADEQADKMIAEVRRLVAEKNDLQQTLDKVFYERNVANDKQAEAERLLTQARQEIAKIKEETDVAWELVAGQKHDRWRPVTWAVGGFVIGFLLSGGYGYYYSEKTRDELLAKLKENEELIKSAAWRQEQQNVNPPQTVASEPVETTAPVAVVDVPKADSGKDLRADLPTEAELAEETHHPPTLRIEPVEEEAKHWWPAGNEFSTTAAIPMETIRAAIDVEDVQATVSDRLNQEVLATVQRWAESWTSQDLSDYFSFYSANYRPELGRSQQEWREMRRSRISRPEWIRLDIDDIRVRKIGENRVQVKMRQSYRSDFYQDEILKSINLIKEDGRWRILMERSLGMIGYSDIVGG